MTNFFDYRNTCRGDAKTYCVGRECQGWSGSEYATKQDAINYIQQIIDSGNADAGEYEIGYFSYDDQDEAYLINAISKEFKDYGAGWRPSDFDGSYTSMVA